VALALDVCGLVDAALSDRVVVFGSLPPEGSDLDLLVRPPEEAALRSALLSAGFVHKGRDLVRFSRCRAYSVELEPVDGLGLPAPKLEALFNLATPLAGFSWLAEPAPPHRLLILAYWVLSGSTVLSPSRRQRVEQALREDPSAWDRAAELAAAWGDPATLVRLKKSFDGESAPSRRRAPITRPVSLNARRGAVIALSGVDGSGKSSQAHSLRVMIEDLGREATIEWLPLASNPLLDRISEPMKRLLWRVPSLQPPVDSEDVGERGIVATPGSMLRERNRAIDYAWTTLVALANGIAHARRCARHLAVGRVVIFDRYVLDSSVRLRFLYGQDRSFRLQRWLIRTLSPRPLCAFFLDVSADTSLQRKHDKWHRDELEAQVALYRSEYARHGVTRLDGERDGEELCAEIAEYVWKRLR
jgi:thymidylate kinase